MSDAARLEGVRKYFGSTRAVDGLTMSVPEGSVVGFLGLNGSGKTTTMRLLTGLIRAEAGRMEVLGENPWTFRPETRRRIGYLSEKDFPFPSFTFEQAAAFVSRFHPSWDPRYLAHLVGLLQIPTNAPYSTLSRGEQRKFQLALTLAPKPELVLLDDPAQGLDVTVRRDFVESVVPLLQEGRSTVLFSSHVMSDVERIADTIAVLHAGRLVLQDSLDRLKERARHVVVSGGEAPELAKAIRVKKLANETRYTVFDPDPKAIEALRGRGARVDVQPVGLEDLFIDVVGAANESG